MAGCPIGVIHEEGGGSPHLTSFEITSGRLTALTLSLSHAEGTRGRGDPVFTVLGRPPGHEHSRRERNLVRGWPFPSRVGGCLLPPPGERRSEWVNGVALNVLARCASDSP